MRQSKKCRASGISRTSASTPCTRRKRRISSWKGSGRPAASRATTSPSRMNGSPERSRRAISTTSGRLRVTSDRRRVQTCTRSPARCSWMRAPHAGAGGRRDVRERLRDVEERQGAEERLGFAGALRGQPSNAQHAGVRRREGAGGEEGHGSGDLVGGERSEESGDLVPLLQPAPRALEPPAEGREIRAPSHTLYSRQDAQARSLPD